MSKNIFTNEKVNKAVEIIAWMGGAYFVATAIAGAVKRKREQGTNGIGAARGRQKKFYVYAGYWENYISSKPMPAPYTIRRIFRDINEAIDYAVDWGDNVVYCENVKYDLPDWLYETLQDEGYEYFVY